MKFRRMRTVTTFGTQLLQELKQYHTSEEKMQSQIIKKNTMKAADKLLNKTVVAVLKKVSFFISSFLW